MTNACHIQVCSTGNRIGCALLYRENKWWIWLACCITREIALSSLALDIRSDCFAGSWNRHGLCLCHMSFRLHLLVSRVEGGGDEGILLKVTLCLLKSNEMKYWSKNGCAICTAVWKLRKVLLFESPHWWVRNHVLYSGWRSLGEKKLGPKGQGHDRGL